jgi:hypothetical protein
MAKEIILYNLNSSITDEEYQTYCREKKGPFFDSLPFCNRFELAYMDASAKGDIPYRYIGIVDVTSLAEWDQTAKSEAFQEFLKEWMPMVADFQILLGPTVYGD